MLILESKKQVKHHLAGSQQGMSWNDPCKPSPRFPLRESLGSSLLSTSKTCVSAFVLKADRREASGSRWHLRRKVRAHGDRLSAHLAEELRQRVLVLSLEPWGGFSEVPCLSGLGRRKENHHLWGAILIYGKTRQSTRIHLSLKTPIPPRTKVTS